MCQRYELAIMPAFGRMLAALSPKAQEQVWRKLPELQADPHPDGTERKQRMEKFDDVYRWRVHKYRVFYRIANCRVVLMAIEHRSEAYRQDELPPDDEQILVEPDEQLEPAARGDAGPADGVASYRRSSLHRHQANPSPPAHRTRTRSSRRTGRTMRSTGCRNADELLSLLERLPQQWLIGSSR